MKNTMTNDELIKNLIFTQKALTHTSLDKIIRKRAKGANKNFLPVDAYSLAELKFYHLCDPDGYKYVIKNKRLYLVTFEDELHTKICSILYKDFKTNKEAYKFIGVIEFLGCSNFDDFEEERKMLVS